MPKVQKLQLEVFQENFNALTCSVFNTSKINIDHIN